MPWPLDRLNRGDMTTVTYTHRPSPHKSAVHAVNADSNTAEPTDTSIIAVGHPKPGVNQTADPGLNRHLPIHLFEPGVPNIRSTVEKLKLTTVLIRVSPIATLGCADPIPHAMAPIGQFLRNMIRPSKGVSLRVVNLKVVVEIRMVVAIRGMGAIKGEKERCIGEDVGRSARRIHHRKK